MALEKTEAQNPLIYPIVSANMVVGVGKYYATEDEGETVKHALVCFGYLLKSVQSVRYSFEDLSKAIEEHYSGENPRTKAVLETLRIVDARNREIASGNHPYVLGD